MLIFPREETFFMSDKKMICDNCKKQWAPSFYDDMYDIDGVVMCESCAMPYFRKSRDLEPINSEYAIRVCQPGQGETTCAFLGASPKFMCTKCTPVEEVLRNKLKNGLMGAKGDNCSGPPAFNIIVVA